MGTISLPTDILTLRTSRLFHTSIVNGNGPSNGDSDIKDSITQSTDDKRSPLSVNENKNDQGEKGDLKLTKEHFLIPRPPRSVASPTRFNKDLETTPAKDINQITADYKNPQGIVKSNYFKPLESTYVANRPLEPMVSNLGG